MYVTRFRAILVAAAVVVSGALTAEASDDSVVRPSASDKSSFPSPELRDGIARFGREMEKRSARYDACGLATLFKPPSPDVCALGPFRVVKESSALDIYQLHVVPMVEPFGTPNTSARTVGSVIGDTFGFSVFATASDKISDAEALINGLDGPILVEGAARDLPQSPTEEQLSKGMSVVQGVFLAKLKLTPGCGTDLDDHAPPLPICSLGKFYIATRHGVTGVELGDTRSSVVALMTKNGLFLPASLSKDDERAIESDLIMAVVHKSPGELDPSNPATFFDPTDLSIGTLMARVSAEIEYSKAFSGCSGQITDFDIGNRCRVGRFYIWKNGDDDRTVSGVTKDGSSVVAVQTKYGLMIKSGNSDQDARYIKTALVEDFLHVKPDFFADKSTYETCTFCEAARN